MAHANGEYNEAALMVRPTELLGQLSSRSIIIAAAGLLAAVAGYFVVGGDHFWPSYLIAYIFWIGITVGSLAVLMVQHLTGGAWTMASRRLLEASTRNLPLMAVLFIPLWLNRAHVWPWISPDPTDEKMQEVLHLKGAYLNDGFFTGRAIAYFAI